MRCRKLKFYLKHSTKKRRNILYLCVICLGPDNGYRLYIGNTPFFNSEAPCLLEKGKNYERKGDRMGTQSIVNEKQ